MQVSHVGADALAVLLQHVPALSLGDDAALPQGCVAQHLPDRHSGRLETAEERDPNQDRCVVVTLARLVPVGIGKQSDPLVIADGVSGQSRTLRQFANLHEHRSRHDASEARNLSAL